MELHGRNDMKLTQGLQAPQHPVPNLLLVPQPPLKLNDPALTLSCVPATESPSIFPSQTFFPCQAEEEGAQAIPWSSLSAQTMSFLHLLDSCKENAREKKPDLQAGTLDAQELRKSLAGELCSRDDKVF